MSTVQSWQKGRFVPLDALRGIAAYLVVFQHGFLHAVDWIPGSVLYRLVFSVCSDYSDLGRIGVVAFFMTSGFVVPFSFKGDRPIRAFILSRFFRLYPAYWFSIALACILSWLLTHDNFSTKQIVVNITMLQTWLHQPDVIGVYWTLAIEQLFYALCVFAFIPGLLHSARYAAGASILFGLMAILFGLIHTATGRDLPTAIPLGLSLMHLGMLARMATIEDNKVAQVLLKKVSIGALILLLVACMLNYPSVPSGKKSTWIAQCTSYVVGYTMFFYFLYRARGGWVQRIAFFGTISYSVYLVHVPVQRFFHELLPDTGPFWGFIYLIAAIVAPLPVSWLVYRLVEKPSVRIGHKLGRRPEKLKVAPKAV